MALADRDFQQMQHLTPIRQLVALKEVIFAALSHYDDQRNQELNGKEN
jgi:hypothetical protein